ncbi:MFS transporter, partial [Pseudonocardia sp. KRD291]|uniref:MFS transporter n=1 Tax=Pseudonocardia sp. KRD291 TaxID=2792007 RepID=UPI001C4A3959
MLWAGQFVNTAGLMMLVPIMPFYIERMGPRDAGAVATWAGVAIAAPALALVIATPLWGRLGDRVGRKWMVVRALVGLAASMAVMATAATPLALVAGRLLQGTLGGVVEAAAGFASTTGEKGKKGAALGKSFSATAAGSLVGPLAGGALVGTGGLSALMLVIGGLAAVVAALCAIGLREPPRVHPAPRSDRCPASPGPGSGRRSRHLPVALPLAVAAAGAYLGVYGLIPIFADYARGLVAEPGSAGIWVGIAQSITWGATLIGSPLWGRYNDRVGRPVQTFAIAALGCGIAIAAQALPVGLAGILVLRILQGVCFAALAQSLFLHASQIASPERAGGAVGSANSFLLAGQSIGPLLAGPLTGLLPATVTIALLGGSC